MSHSIRIRTVIFACLLLGVGARAESQTRKLTIHLSFPSAAADVRVLSGGSSPVAACTPGGNNPCIVFVNHGASVDRSVAGLAPGVYNLVVHSHSTVTGAFNNVALVQVTLQ